MLTALPDRGAASLRRFEAVAHHLYRGDSNWVSPLFDQVEEVLGPTNPFWEHADVQLWTATCAGEPVGRIAAIHDRTHNATHQERTAHFGWFEAVNDPHVSEALFSVAARWARERRLDHLAGPMCPSINSECGLLIEGFDSPPVLMMTYAPPYYRSLVEGAGFTKLRDLHAYYIDHATCPAERLRRLGDLFRRRYPHIRVRPVTRRTLDADVPRIERVYNDAWEHNWGAVPLTSGEIRLLVKQLRPLLVDGLVWLAETDTDAVGFMLVLPDANEILRPLRGRLLSRGLWRALPYLVGWKRPRIMRLIALGTRREFRGRGLEAVMFSAAHARAVELGIVGCEASWVLEDNQPVERLIDVFHGRRYKTYRLYGRDLTTDHPVETT